MNKWTLRLILAGMLCMVAFSFYACNAEPCSFFGTKDFNRYDCKKIK